MCTFRGCSLAQVGARCSLEAILSTKCVLEMCFGCVCCDDARVLEMCLCCVYCDDARVLEMCLGCVCCDEARADVDISLQQQANINLLYQIKHYNMALFIIQLTVDKLHMQLIKLLSVNMRKGFDSVGDSN